MNIAELHDDMIIGDAVEGYTVTEMARWQLRTDRAWNERIAETQRLIAGIDRELENWLPGWPL